MGEICLKGHVPFLGYLNDTVQTETAHHEGYFKTGDIGYFDDDCFLYIVGRKSEMLLFNGIKFQATEIEEILNSIQGIESSLVVGVRDEKAENDIIFGFIKKKANEPDMISEQYVHNYLNSKVVDEKKLRGGIHFIDMVPKTATGKINRAELKKLAKKIVQQQQSTI